jgi:flagellar motor switch protein FliM
MADVLSQAEVEALLAALETGGSVAKAAAGQASEPIEREPLPADVTLYDFKRPERVSKEHMRGLQTIHEGFSRNFGASLSGFLRAIVDVKLVSVDQLTYSEFVFSLENPTCYAILTCAPLDGHVVVEINSSIVYPIIDRLLGGGSTSVHIPSRPLTEIETRLIRRVLEHLVSDLRSAWSIVLPVNFQLDRIESNPQLVYIVPPNEVVVLVSVEIAIADLRGMINLCIPFNVIEPVMNTLAANTWVTYARHHKDQGKQDVVLRGLGTAPVELIAYLGETTLTARDVVHLHVGDLIMIDKPADSEVLISVGNQPKFRAEPAQYRGRLAVRLTRVCDSTARING